MVPDIFHRDFTPTPYWWEAYTPTAGELVDVPPEARVAIVGGGYAGLSTALELAKHGIDAVVLEANELGFGASTRNGGAVSGGVNLGKSFTGKTIEVDRERAERVLSDAADAFALIDRLIDEERIACFWEKPGRFVGAWTRKHFDGAVASARNAQYGSPIRRLYGAARAAARGDRQRLLFRRHGRRAIGQIASGALLQGSARGLPPPRRLGLRQGDGHRHRPVRQRLAGRDRPRATSRPAMS